MSEMIKEKLPMEQLIRIIDLQLENGGTASLTVTGNSMMPMLHNEKDVVYLQRPERCIRKNELILFRRTTGKYVLHRAISVKEDGSLICCGDNQCWPEEITQEQVVALVTGFSRRGKRHEVTERGYHAYVAVWRFLYPVRRPILAVMHRLPGGFWPR